MCFSFKKNSPYQLSYVYYVYYSQRVDTYFFKFNMVEHILFTTYISLRAHAHAHTNKPTHTHKHKRTHTHKHTHTHTQTHTLKHTQKHTYTHARTNSPALLTSANAIQTHIPIIAFECTYKCIHCFRMHFEKLTYKMCLLL